MALHTDTEIYKATYDLCKLVTELVANMQRNYKADFGAELRKRCMALVMRTYEANTSEDKPPILRGIDYVGQVIKPWRRTTRTRTLHQALSRLEEMPSADVYASGKAIWDWFANPVTATTNAPWSAERY